jgi:hypothetical protein
MDEAWANVPCLNLRRMTTFTVMIPSFFLKVTRFPLSHSGRKNLFHLIKAGNQKRNKSKSREKEKMVQGKTMGLKLNKPEDGIQKEPVVQPSI